MADGRHSRSLVTITGADDAPTIVSGATTASNTTSAMAIGSVTGIVAFADVDSTDTHSTTQAAPTFSWSGGTLSEAQKTAFTNASTLALVETDSTGAGSGSVAWSYSAAAHTFDFLAVGETLTITYNVTINDGHGGMVSQPLTVTIGGVNTPPTIVAGSTTPTGAFSELANKTGDTTDQDQASGTLAFADVNVSDTHTVAKNFASAIWVKTGGVTAPISDPGTLTLGTLDDAAKTVTWTYAASDATFDFLAAGETLVVTYNVTISDGHGGTASQPVTLTVTGTNDAPTIVAGSTTATGAISELANTTGSSASDSASGTIAFKDVDLDDTHSVSQAAPTFSWSGGTLSAGQQAALTTASTLALTKTDSTGTGSGSVAWTYAANDATFDFLAAGETLAVTYAVTIKDNNNATATQNVTLTVTGTNDAPTIVAGSTTATGAISELANTTGSSASDSASGTIAFKDVDLDNTHSVSQAAPTFSWSGGTLSAVSQAALTTASTLALTKTDSTGTGSGSVAWTYAANDATFDFLAAGETLAVTYDVTITDNNNATATQTVTLTVTGTNDAPTIVAGSTTATGAISELAKRTTSSTRATAPADASVQGRRPRRHAQREPGAPTFVGPARECRSDSGLTTASTLALSKTDSTGPAPLGGLELCGERRQFDFLADGETLAVTYEVTVKDTTTRRRRERYGDGHRHQRRADDRGGPGDHGDGRISELANTTGPSANDSASGTIAFKTSISTTPTA